MKSSEEVVLRSAMTKSAHSMTPSSFQLIEDPGDRADWQPPLPELPPLPVALEPASLPLLLALDPQPASAIANNKTKKVFIAYTILIGLDGQRTRPEWCRT